MRARELSRRAVLALVTAGAGALAWPRTARAQEVVAIDVGGKPAGVAVNHVTGFAYVTDPESGSVSVVVQVTVPV